MLVSQVEPVLLVKRLGDFRDSSTFTERNEKVLNLKDRRIEVGLVSGFLVVLVLFLSIIFRATCVTFIDKHEIGFVFNRMNGTITKVDRSGYILRWPIVYSVHSIDLRPYQVSIITMPGGRGMGSEISSRILNAKLVRFNPEGLDTFIQWHGRGAGDSINNLLEILKCYAFDQNDGANCPFLTVLSEIAPTQVGAMTPEKKEVTQ